MMDALEMRAGLNSKETDADDILFYLKALAFGTERLQEFPFSLRFIKELHGERGCVFIVKKVPLAG